MGMEAGLDRNDSIITTYRCHGIDLVRGDTVEAVMAEMFGFANGNAGGKGGSMHLYHPETNYWGGCGNNSQQGTDCRSCCTALTLVGATLCYLLVLGCFGYCNRHCWSSSPSGSWHCMGQQVPQQITVVCCRHMPVVCVCAVYIVLPTHTANQRLRAVCVGLWSWVFTCAGLFQFPSACLEMELPTRAR